MRRVLLLSILSLTTTAGASPSVCPANTTPMDAAPADYGVRKAQKSVAQALRIHTQVSRSATDPRFCLTPGSIFYNPQWLSQPKLIGGPVAGPGFGMVAYAVGVHRYVFGKGPWPSADEAGAWHIGCALTREGIVGAQRERVAQLVEAETVPHVDSSAWQAWMRKGAVACSAR